MEEAEAEPAVRQEMVTTAVRFLENARVRSSSEEMKRSFLQKKGLTEAEILEAFRRMEARPVQPLLVPQPQTLQVVQTSSLGTRLRDILNLLLLIGGASYSLRYLWKRYVQPWLMGPRPAPQDRLVETCQAVLASVQQLQEVVTSLQASVASQAEQLQEAGGRQEGAGGRQEGAGELKELKAEIQSVKGLLLSSRSFPQQPRLSPPSLPSWQLQDTQDKGPDLVSHPPPGKDSSPQPPSPGDSSPQLPSLEQGQGSSSTQGSSASEIEMLSPDSGQELSGEEGQ